MPQDLCICFNQYIGHTSGLNICSDSGLDRFRFTYPVFSRYDHLHWLWTLTVKELIQMPVVICTTKEIICEHYLALRTLELCYTVFRNSAHFKQGVCRRQRPILVYLRTPWVLIKLD